MAFTKLTENVSILSTLDARPNESTGQDYRWMQGKFDEAPEIIKTFINALIDAMAAQTGGQNIGITPITGVNVTNVQAAVAQLQANILAIQAGVVSDGSITSAKLADLSVATAKLAEMAVSTAKLADLAVTAAKIATGAVTEAKLGSGAVTNGKIADGAISAGKLGEDVNAYFRKVADKVSASDIEGAIASTQLADGSVATAKVADGAVNGSKLNLANNDLGAIQLRSGVHFFASESARNSAIPSPVTGQITFIKK